ncbi:hypothetical protein ACCO45_009264 [Purpureocillium lilacinum]|uniref:Uncharacterized protein n=1 Tax=Purpureocillium lilacinum TaxID=33203 RepID=A0ACC4DK86_PURLI
MPTPSAPFMEFALRTRLNNGVWSAASVGRGGIKAWRRDVLDDASLGNFDPSCVWNPKASKIGEAH